jgi:hypothetical protein
MGDNKKIGLSFFGQKFGGDATLYNTPNTSSYVFQHLPYAGVRLFQNVTKR